VALVVLLRGVNVGGHKTFRPARLADELRHLGAVNIGAAGTFVIRQPVSRADLRLEFARRLPFEAGIAVVDGREIGRLMSLDVFSGRSPRPDIVHFVSVMCGRARATPRLPMQIPARGRWLLEVLARDGPFVVGRYRREMKAIGQLGTLDRLFGVPVTTRNWNTMAAIGKILDRGAS
jgi:uncharacterized protein (DUF1697 family)